MGLIAGSLGPTGGSYQPELAPPTEQAAELFAELSALQAPFVDLLILETMASIAQAKGALTGALSVGKPVWLAVTVSDEDGSILRSGEALTDVLPLLQEFSVDALLVNCSTPEAVSTAIPLLANQGVPLGAYANGFTHIKKEFLKPGASVDVLEEREDLNAESYANFADKWIADGASIVGGCCCVGPLHIAELHRRLK